MENIKYENKDLCKKCGGYCCKKSGCMYFVDDLKPFNKENVKKMLDTGNVSIKVTFDIRKDNGRYTANPCLNLVVRSIDRGVVDLFSFKRQCSMLTSSGCTYDFKNRPSGAINLIPHMNLETGEFDCKPLVDPLVELKKYMPYQNLLMRMVKYYSGKSFDVKLKEDIEDYFYKVISEDFDGIMDAEIKELVSGVGILSGIFSNEWEKAVNRYENGFGKVKVKSFK